MRGDKRPEQTSEMRHTGGKWRKRLWFFSLRYKQNTWEIINEIPQTGAVWMFEMEAWRLPLGDFRGQTAHVVLTDIFMMSGRVFSLTINPQLPTCHRLHLLFTIAIILFLRKHRCTVREFKIFASTLTPCNYTKVTLQLSNNWWMSLDRAKCSFDVKDTLCRNQELNGEILCIN